MLPKFPSILLAGSVLSSEESPKRSKSTQSQPRSVTFSATVEVYPILHRRDMSVDEVQKAWTHRLERRQSQIAVENTVYLMRTGVGIYLSEFDHFCSRGLEHYLYHEASSEYNFQVKKSRQIALVMQRILRRCGKSNPEMIARAYRRFTLDSRRIAYHQAEIDRAYVVEGTHSP